MTLLPAQDFRDNTAVIAALQTLVQRPSAMDNDVFTKSGFLQYLPGDIKQLIRHDKVRYADFNKLLDRLDAANNAVNKARAHVGAAMTRFTDSGYLQGYRGSEVVLQKWLQNYDLSVDKSAKQDWHQRLVAMSLSAMTELKAHFADDAEQLAILEELLKAQEDYSCTDHNNQVYFRKDIVNELIEHLGDPTTIFLVSSTADQQENPIKSWMRGLVERTAAERRMQPEEGARGDRSSSTSSEASSSPTGSSGANGDDESVAPTCVAEDDGYMTAVPVPFDLRVELGGSEYLTDNDGFEAELGKIDQSSPFRTSTSYDDTAPEIEQTIRDDDDEEEDDSIVVAMRDMSIPTPRGLASSTGRR
ncbi:MAG: hypothetical protein CMF50_02520 [Legionellales bacterium]|nr:hypothetical protein [Legionellales bacterium]